MENVEPLLDGSQSVIGGFKTNKFREMIKQKECEMQALTERQYVELELEIGKKEEELEKRNHEFQRLQHDFKYNLQLLEDRDEELRSYDTRFAAQTAALEEKERTVHEMRLKLSALEATCHDVRMQKEVELKETLIRMEQDSLCAKRKQEELERLVRELQEDKKDCETECARRLAEKDVALLDQHRTFTDKIEEQVRHFDSECALAEERRLHQLETAENQIQMLQRDMSACEGIKRNVEVELQKCQDQFVNLKGVYKREQLEKAEEAARTDSLLREKSARIESLTLEIQRSRDDSQSSMQRMEDEMQVKVQESFRAIRVLVEENKEKQTAAQEDAEKCLAQSRKLHAEDVARLQTQIDHMQRELLAKDHAHDAEITAMVARIDQCEREKADCIGEKELAVKEAMDRAEAVKNAADDKLAAVTACLTDEKRDLLEQIERVKILAEKNTTEVSASEERELEIKLKLSENEEALRTRAAEIETLKSQLQTARIDEEKARTEVMDLMSKRSEGRERMQKVTPKVSKFEKLEEDFDPLWSGDFGPPSPMSWGMLQASPKALPESPKPRNGEVEKLEKQNEDLRAAISRMIVDAKNMAPRDGPELAKAQEKCSEKEAECEELRQRNWALKQDNERLAAERAQLMELSNTLRADILLRQSAAQLNRETHHQYDNKIAEIEDSIKDLGIQNALNPQAQAPSRAALENAAAQTEAAPVPVTNRALARERRARTPERRRVAWRDETSELRSSTEAPREAPSEAPREDGMELVGRSVSPSERKHERVTSSERSTASQAEKLRAIQRRRQGDRDRVRNWNDFRR